MILSLAYYLDYLKKQALLNGTYDQKLITLGQTSENSSEDYQKIRVIMFSKAEKRLSPFIFTLIKKHQEVMFSNIIKWSQSNDSDLKEGIAELAQSLRDPRFIPSLEILAKDEKPGIAKKSLEALSFQGTPSSKAVLLSYYKNRDNPVDLRRDALKGFMKNNLKTEYSLLKGTLKDSLFTDITLSHLSDSVVVVNKDLTPVLIEILRKENRKYNSLVFLILAKIAVSDALTQAMSSLRNSEYMESSSAILYLTSIKEIASREILDSLSVFEEKAAERTDSSDAIYLKNLLACILKMRDRKSIPILMRQNWRETRYFMDILGTLSKLEAYEAIPLFRKMCNDDSKEALKAAILWGEMKDEEAIPYLANHLQETINPAEREEIYLTLAGINSLEAISIALRGLKNKVFSESITTELKNQKPSIDSLVSLEWSNMDNMQKNQIYKVLAAHKSDIGKRILIKEYEIATEEKQVKDIEKALISFEADEEIGDIFINRLEKAETKQEKEDLLLCLARGRYRKARDILLKSLSETRGELRGVLVQYFRDDNSGEVNEIMWLLLKEDDLETVVSALEIIHKNGKQSDMKKLIAFEKDFRKRTKERRIYEWDQNSIMLIEKIDDLIEKTKDKWK